jgi:hypothetical protein
LTLREPAAADGLPFVKRRLSPTRALKGEEGWSENGTKPVTSVLVRGLFVSTKDAV